MQIKIVDVVFNNNLVWVAVPVQDFNLFSLFKIVLQYLHHYLSNALTDQSHLPLHSKAVFSHFEDINFKYS